MKAYLIAGEASGDRLGGALLKGLRALRPDLDVTGIGGAEMAGQGLASLFPMDELSVMGLAEILPKYRHLVARINETAADVLAQRPDVLITIDSPDFCQRVARRVRAANRAIRIVHYVAPTVWAWRPGRARKMAGHVDQVLALYPFEPPYMRAVGMRCDFVGHPVVAAPVPGDAEVAAFRAEHGLGAAPILLVLPGSRRNEVSRLLPVFGDAIRRMVAVRPDLRVVLPAAPGLAEMVGATTRGWPGQPVILTDDLPPDDREARKRTAFRAADIAIAASGTVSLELAAAATPMVIAYDMNWLSWQVISRMVNLSTVTLVNLVAGRNVVPEFLGPDCRAGRIADAALALMEDEFRRSDQLAAMRETMVALGRGAEDPGLRAARAILDGLPG